MERALRPNLARRDFSSGQKREAVKRYLLNHWDGERGSRDIAKDLGVSHVTVSRAKNELEGDGKLEHLKQFSKAEKQEQVGNYLDSNPDASNRKVAGNIEADVSHTTVGNWRNEWDSDETDTESEQSDESDTEARTNGSGLKAYATDSDDVEAATQLFKEREQDETAEKKAREVTEGKQSPSKLRGVLWRFFK